MREKRLSELISKFKDHKVRAKGFMDPAVKGISIDSRTLRPGELFIALPGTRTDGFGFIKAALRKGAVALVVPLSRMKEVPIDVKVPVVGVLDIQRAPGLLASSFYGDPSRRLVLIGITGTNGKTTIAYLIESILKHAGLEPGIITTIETGMGEEKKASELTTPDPVSLQRHLAAMAEKGAKAVVMEVSSHALTQNRVAGCSFSLAVFTNLTRDHLDYHKDMEEYFQAKSRLFLELDPKMSVINLDDPYGLRLWDMIPGDKLSYGMDQKAQVKPGSYRISKDGIYAAVSAPDGSKIELSSRLLGRHNLSNILGAVAGAISLGIDKGAIERGIGDVTCVPGRLEQVKVKADVTCLVDYAHTPEGLRSVLETLRECQFHRIITVVGCGGDRDPGKRPQMARAAAELSDIVVFTSDNPRSEDPEAILMEMMEGIVPERTAELYGPCRVHVIKDRFSAIKKACQLARPGDLVLIAGKGHETYQIIGDRKIFFDDRVMLKKAMGQDDQILVSQFIDAIGGQVVSGNPDAVEFKGIVTDTRQLVPGRLFLALKGERFDAHDFVLDALGKGASGIIVSRLPRDMGPYKDALVIKVTDTLKALGELASWYRDRIGAKVVGITGSCGKTSTKELIAQVLSERWRVSKTRGNFNNLIGLPLCILESPIDTEWMVLEMGMNRPGEIGRLSQIASPCIGVLTNIKPAHLQGMGDLEHILQEKMELIKSIPRDGIGVLNMDDPLIFNAAKKIDKRIIWYSLNPRKGAKVYAKAFRADGSMGTVLDLVIGDEQVTVRLSLLGSAGVQNALCAAAVGHALGLSSSMIAKALSKARPFKGRLFPIKVSEDLKVIDDSYNANPGSMAAALEILGSLTNGSAKVAVLGDMLELGQDAKRFHRQIGREAGAIGPELLIFVGDFSDYYMEGAKDAGLGPETCLCFPDVETLVRWLRDEGYKQIKRPATFLFKGSRAVGLDRAVSALCQDLSGEGKEVH